VVALSGSLTGRSEGVERRGYGRSVGVHTENLLNPKGSARKKRSAQNAIHSMQAVYKEGVRRRVLAGRRSGMLSIQKQGAAAEHGGRKAR